MSNKVVRGIRDGLVIVAAVLMFTMVGLQWMEIKEFELEGIIKTRIAELFASDAPEAPAEPAAPAPDAANAPAAEAAPAAPAAPQSSGAGL